MAGYVVFIRNQLRDQAGIDTYHEIVKDSPMEKLRILAPSGSRFEMLEGPSAEAVVLLRFPTMEDALEWYNSEPYQRGLPYRVAAGDYRVLVVEGSD